MTAVLAVSSHVLSQYKPFNPLLGETFTGKYDEETKIFMEHISHHPAISFFNVENPNWSLFGRWLYNAKIGLTCFDIFNEGWLTLKFKDNNETFMIKYPESALKGMVTGNRGFKVIGTIVVL